MSEAQTAGADWVSINAYARHKNVEPKSVRKAIKEGRVVQDMATGKINLPESDKYWDAGRTKAPPPGQNIVTALDPGDSLAARMTNAKLSKEQQAARLAKIKVDQIEGKLISVKSVEALWSKIISITKTRLLAVPSKVRSQIPKLSTEEILMIEEEIRTALESLSAQDPDAFGVSEIEDAEELGDDE